MSSTNRRLGFEPLEDRRMLAVITVNTTADENNGIGVGGISLRDAVSAAGVGDTINFSVTGTISLLGGSGFGQISINKNLTIQGPGANLLTVKAFDPDPGGTNNSNGQRVFSVDDGGGLANVTISSLTLTNGDPTMADEFDGGGAILNRENLTLNSCALSGNNAKNGGAILSTAGTLTINDSSISSNNASDGDGGAVYVNGGSLAINRSTIANNSASNSGGGIDIQGRPVTIVDSTISGNQANETGGGIYQYQGSLSITGSTISGNSAAQGGAGIFSYAGQTVSISHSTIAGNVAGTNVGGINSSGTVSLNHTIVAGNLTGGSTREDVSGTINALYSLIGDKRNATVNNTGGSLIGTTGSPIDAKLAPLANNGGPTQTHALQSGSPALEAGNPSAVANANGIPQFDQRGNPFSRVVDYDGVGGARIDIGAVEMAPAVPALLGDYNRNQTVDAADFVLWRKTLNGTVSQPYNGADGDGNSSIAANDYTVWRSRFGNTPPGAGATVDTLSAEPVLSDASGVPTDGRDATSLAFAELARTPIIRPVTIAMFRTDQNVSASETPSTDLLLAVGASVGKTNPPAESDNGSVAIEPTSSGVIADDVVDPLSGEAGNLFVEIETC